METISRSFHEKKKGYAHSAYLVYVATKNLLCKLSRQRIAFTLGPGQGKSWAALLLAEKHAKDGKFVTIVVPNEVILEQFETMISDYCSDKVTVLMACQLPLNHHNHIYIFDECDHLIE